MRSAEARYALRCFLVGLATFAGSMQTLLIASTVDTQGTLAALCGAVVLALAYAGIGAGSGSVEPFIGRKLEPPPVPPEGDQAGK